MLHNKHYEVLEQFLHDYSKELYGRNLLDKVSLSQKNIALTLDELEKHNILKSRTEGNIKYFRINTDYSEIKDIISIAETIKKLNLLEKHRKLSEIFKKDSRIIGIFGSYSKGFQKPGSDIDMFVIGKKVKEDYDKKGKKFDFDISIKYFTEQNFKKLSKNNLIKEIMNNHVIIFGIEEFVKTVWGNYYDFS